jgi:hypothetical protein
MTVETATGMTAQTFTLVHPPGFSIRDSDNTPEVVTKNNAATAFALGDIVQVVANTSAGEAWAAKTGADNASKRYGHVTIASGGGTPTMTIVRHPRVVIPSYSGRMLSYAATTASNLVLETPTQDKSVIAGPAIEVTKPAGEFWSSGSVVYAYLSGASTLYTSNSATANAADVAWIAGGIVGVSYGLGVTTAVIKESLGMDAELLTRSGRLPINDTSELAIPSAVTLQLGAQLYVGPLRDQVLATTFGAASPILIGTLASFDKTTTPATYTYWPGNNVGVINHSVEYQQCRTQGHCFAQVTPVIFPDLSATASVNAIPLSDWICLLGSFSSPTTKLQRDCVMTQRIITGAPPAIDMALDVDLPSPWTTLRIIWSCSLLFGSTNPLTFNMLPLTSRRTTAAAAPITGMQRAPGFRAPYFNSQTFIPRGQARSSGAGYGASEAQAIDHFLSGHRNVPHVFWGYKPDASGFGGSGVNDRVRIGEIPTIRWYWDATVGIEWAWGRYDYATSSVVYLTAWTAATPAGGTIYYADVGLPPLTDGDVHRLQVFMREGGVTISVAATDNTAAGTSTWWSIVYDGIGYGCYPYDISQMRLADDAGSSWVGHAGWCWPEPTITEPTWGATIAPTWTPATDTLVMPVLNPVASRAADTHVGPLGANGVQTLRANYGPTLSALAFQASAVNYSFWRDNGGAISQKFNNGATFRIGAPAPTPVSIDLEVLYVVQADSSYGKMYWIKTDRVPLAWP